MLEHNMTYICALLAPHSTFNFCWWGGDRWWVRERRGTSEEILFLAGNGCGLRDEINFSKRKAFRSVFKLFSSLHLCENIGLSTGTYRYYSTVQIYLYTKFTFKLLSSHLTLSVYLCVVRECTIIYFKKHLLFFKCFVNLQEQTERTK